MFFLLLDAAVIALPVAGLAALLVEILLTDAGMIREIATDSRAFAEAPVHRGAVVQSVADLPSAALA